MYISFRYLIASKFKFIISLSILKVGIHYFRILFQIPTWKLKLNYLKKRMLKTKKNI